MDATRSGAVLARHAGIDEKTGQLTPDDDDGEPRRLVISSDFYAVYQSAGKKAGGLVNLYCWAHIRRYFVRAGDANPAQLGYWTAAWLELIRNLYAAHAQLTTAWAQAAAPAPREAAAAAARLEEWRASNFPDCGSFRILNRKGKVNCQEKPRTIPRSSARKPPAWWRRRHALSLTSPPRSGSARPPSVTG